MCTNVMCVYLFHEIANILFFSYLLTRVYMDKLATLSVVLVVLYEACNGNGS